MTGKAKRKPPDSERLWFEDLSPWAQVKLGTPGLCGEIEVHCFAWRGFSYLDSTFFKGWKRTRLRRKCWSKQRLLKQQPHASVFMGLSGSRTAAGAELLRNLILGVLGGPSSPSGPPSDSHSRLSS